MPAISMLLDDIIYSASLGPRVTTVAVMEDYKLALTFTNGETRLFDAKPLLEAEAFEPLADSRLFESVTVAYGTLLWPDDIDCCPDTLYAESVTI